MKTILITAYALNPFKGSEDGMGWNFVRQAAKHHRVIAVTRKNNRIHIEKYLQQHPEIAQQANLITFYYFDWPAFLLQWKKGPLLSMIYFYAWQLTLALWLLKKRFAVDVVHNLNFHNNWTPTFLWLLGKPLVWGPVGHHPKIPANFLLPVYGKVAYLKDRSLWGMKNVFWKTDPFLHLSARKSGQILCMHPEAAQKLHLHSGQYSILPSVATEAPGNANTGIQAKKKFCIISAGRFVPLKGFDITIRAFARFYRNLQPEEQQQVSLMLVGSGPCLPLLQQIIAQEQIGNAVQITEWLPRAALQELYKQASAFLFPSHEGAGMVVAEAMSYGLPVLCWNNCGPGRFLHPQSGLKVNYGTYEEGIKQFSENLLLLFRNKDFYLRETDLSTQRFKAHFDWNIRAGQLRRIYRFAYNAHYGITPAAATTPAPQF
ncbi:hypothetical protein C7N43_24330 [Sphingobacteriales bacterium UPWRP_1]|nr:hypothetical protein BVG80_16670 [Sphingobacteriales bacterium TSM_CSM]PSJ74384.1 hypothetical protein C7N43_24330 [Sphingobacteriales bacterium UPWRP_1]